MRCGVCGSERLSPLGELRSAEKWNDRLELRFPRSGFFKARPTYAATFARACRDCGALIPFLSAFDLQRLEDEADGLGDVTG